MMLLLAPTLAAFLSGARCESEVRRELEAWDARSDSLFAGAPDPTASRVALVPTRELGVWVKITKDPEGRVSLVRLTAALAEERGFGPGCETIARGSHERSVAPGGFSDDALAEKLRQGASGVILLWSPHMPLSVDAFAVLSDLTQKMGIELLALLDPGADAAYARAVAAERAMPVSTLRPLSAIELAFRGLTTHAPAIQVFSEGKLVGPVVPGFRTSAGFRLAIERALEER